MGMVRERKGERLRAWLEDAHESGIAEMKSFVAGIERDYDVVTAGLTLRWSQGPVKVWSTRLKRTKD